MEEKNIENKDICAKCGGLCCQKSGCNYIASDIKSYKFADLKALLDEGNISIKGTMRMLSTSGYQLLLTLKARSFDKGIVDLFSASTRCKMWTKEHGCTYTLAQRPSMGAGLIPNPKMGCSENKISEEEMIEGYLPHQDVLKKMVRIYTGKRADVLFEEEFVKESARIIAKGIKMGKESLTIGEEEIFYSLKEIARFVPDLVGKALVEGEHLAKEGENI